MSEMYNRMKVKGIDMSWYEKNKHMHDSGAVPLDDEECSNGSIYHLALDGSLWTIDIMGAPYKKVRDGIKEQKRTIYICTHCKKQWDQLIDLMDKDFKVMHPTVVE